MTEHATCPECGKPLPAGSTHDLCPACLMGQVMASRTLDTVAGNEPTAPPPTPEEIADKFPQFEVVECLGRGGMGVVYRARQKSLDRWVAIKVLAPELVHDERFAEHFEREAKTLARMSHPNIVTVFDHGETGGLFYIVMEFVDGVNLRDLLREAKMEPEQALTIIPPICDALEYAHDKGVVHRDIKPENILLDREGRVKIADFGIASLVGVSGEKSGTPPYMAPEQEKGTVDRRADIYALGVVLYEMLTGERPNKELIAPSKKVHIDVRLDEIVLRALEKTPELRYQTAGEFRTQVKTIASTSGNFGAKEPQIHKSEIDNHPSDVSSRFSRSAIVGACWALAAVLHYLVPTLGYRMKSEFVPIMMSILGLSAPIGTTILGWIAVWQIRRSAGKLRGMRLAVFDGLFFPLLLLVVAVGFTFGLLISELEMGSPKTVHVYALALLVCSPLCWFIVRRVRRKVSKPLVVSQTAEQPRPTSIQPPAAESKPTPLGKWAVGLFIGVVVGAPVLWGFMGAQEVIVLCGLALLLSLVLGVMSWRSKPGKFAALASGLGLLLLAAFTFNYITPRPPRGTYDGGGRTSAYTPVKDDMLLAAISARYRADESRFELGKPIDLDLVFLNHSPIDIVVNPQELPTAAWLTVTNSAGDRVELKGTNQAASVLKGPHVLKSRAGTGGYAMSLLLLPKDDTTTAKNAKADAMAWVEPGTYTLQFHLRLPPTSYQPDGSSNKEYQSVPLAIEVAGTHSAGVSVMPSNSFGPVVERELILGEKDVLRGLYLESGNLISLTSGEHSRVKEIEGGHKSGSTTRDWFDSKQLDIAISSWGDNFRIVGAEGRFVLNTLPAEKWETATYTDVSNAVALETIIMARTKRKFAPTLVSSDGHWAFRQIHRNPELPITYAMRSGNKLGLLQITSRMVYPPGIKLRYKLLQNDAVDQIVPNIYGRELGDLKCFDFESNRFHTPPEALADELLSAVNRAQRTPPVPWHRVSPALIGWLDQTGVDVVAASYDSGAELLSLGPGRTGTVVMPLKPLLAEIDPSQAPFGPANLSFPENALTLERIAYLDWPRKPRTEFYGFQTREGNRGVVQITGITDNRFRDVKVRYKLVQTASHSDPIADPTASDTSAVDGSWGEHFKNGEIHRAQNKLEDSLASYRLSLAVVQAEMKRRPQDAAWQTVGQRRNKQSLTRIGDVLCAQGDHAGALENYRAAMASIEPLVRKVPTDEAQRNELAALYVKIGDVLEATGDRAGALAAFRKAQEVDFPNFQTWEETFKSIGGDYNPATAFKPDELRQLAANPKSHGDFRRLMWLINRAGAEKDAGFRYLLDKPELRKNEEVNLALIGYDYSVNGNPKALDELLAKLAMEKVGSDSSAVVALSFVDEWDRVPKVVKAHFSEADGAGGTSQASYKLRSAYYFPRNSLEHEGKAGEGAPVRLLDRIASFPPGFGPVVERLVPRLAAGNACLLDFETNEFRTPPDDLAEKMKRNGTEKAELSKSSLRWLRESGVDIAAAPDSDTFWFLGVIANTYWGNGGRPFRFDDLTPEIVIDVLSGPLIQPERKPGIYSSIVPAGYGAMVFITSQGNMGVLEIPGGINDPAGVKIRYKLLRGVKPSAEAMAAAKVVWDLPPIEPVKELDIPQQEFPEGAGRMGYRFTVSPGEGDYVLATVREYEGSDTVGEKTPVKRQAARLLRTQGATHSEDVFLDSYRVERPIREGEADRFAFSGFGQQVAITGLEYAGGFGLAVSSGISGQDLSPGLATRRFKFTDTGGDKARTRIVEFELQVIDSDEAAALAKHHGISLPDENVANWAITLSAEQTKEGEKAGQ